MANGIQPRTPRQRITYSFIRPYKDTDEVQEIITLRSAGHFLPPGESTRRSAPIRSMKLAFQAVRPHSFPVWHEPALREIGKLMTRTKR